MKGIILSGGKGTRLHPSTISTSKQLLPVYDKPMIYYPLTTLMLAGIRDFLIISTPEDLPQYKKLLKNGWQWGVNFSYAEQANPNGLPEAFIIGEDFIAEDSVAMILGDNIFFGSGLSEQLREVSQMKKGAHIFAYEVKDPERYAVVEFDENKKVISIEEKPEYPKSNYAVPGLYFFDKNVCEYSKILIPSARNELEIVALFNLYAMGNELSVNLISRGTAWLDAGTPESLLQSSNFIAAIEERQGVMIACPEEIAYELGFITLDMLIENINHMGKNDYQKYLLRMIHDGIK